MAWFLVLAVAAVVGIAFGLICLAAVRCGCHEDGLRERLADGAGVGFTGQSPATVEDSRGEAEDVSDRPFRLKGWISDDNTFI
jgi:hypothetical protein